MIEENILVNSPNDLKKLTLKEKKKYAKYLRDKIIKTVSQNGGHLASNLGVIELSIAIHSTFDSPKDKIIWDVSHQAYAHKIITGRGDSFHTLRKMDGLSGFTSRQESEHDCFTFGHAGSSISVALGMANARDLKGTNENIIAIIGDGSASNGLAVEALNNTIALNTNIIIILNDNEMSIAKNVGAFATHFSNLRLKKEFTNKFSKLKNMVQKIPFGNFINRTTEGIVHGFIRLFQSERGVFFEEIGMTYLGPFDGHNIEEMEKALKGAKEAGGAVVLHVITQKGLGYKHAEDNPNKFHGIGCFHVENGVCLKSEEGISFTQSFSDALSNLARENENICAITSGMPDGTGLLRFSKEFPHRFHDVGIAEGHALTFAAGLAVAGKRPVVAVYSTFLQRAYDNVLHDICLQNLPVVISIDRGGIVGEDGPTHHGVFDVAFLRHMPNIVLCSPRNAIELKNILSFAFNQNSPIAIRYPRGLSVEPFDFEKEIPIVLGKSEILQKGTDCSILTFGQCAYYAIKARRILADLGISAEVCDMKFAKPIDLDYLKELASKNMPIFTVEDGIVKGGFGSGVLEALLEIKRPDLMKKIIGIGDFFVEHGDCKSLHDKVGISPEKVAETIVENLS